MMFLIQLVIVSVVYLNHRKVIILLGKNVVYTNSDSDVHS